MPWKTWISVHVFGYENEKVYPLRINDNVHKDSEIIDLLLISNDTTNHYYLIKSLSRLLNVQNGGHAKHHCKQCVVGFKDKKSLDKHSEYCREHDVVNYELEIYAALVTHSPTCNIHARHFGIRCTFYAASSISWGSAPVLCTSSELKIVIRQVKVSCSAKT